MEEENQVFGRDAEAIENDINLESEDFCFYNRNKEEAKKNLDISAKEWTDYVDSLIKDVPDLSEEEVNAGVEKILKAAYPDKAEAEVAKTNKNKKVTLKVLFIAAVISIVSFCGLFVVGSSHNISIENGFVAFAKETVQVVFFGDEKEEFISVDALLANLEEHGYGDIMFPYEFITNSDNYKVSVPVYCKDEIGEQTTFDIYNGEKTYKFGLHSYDQSQQTIDYTNVNNAQSIQLDGFCANVFELNDSSVVEFIFDEYKYNIKANIPYFEMVEIIKTIK